MSRIKQRTPAGLTCRAPSFGREFEYGVHYGAVKFDVNDVGDDDGTPTDTRPLRAAVHRRSAASMLHRRRPPHAQKWRLDDAHDPHQQRHARRLGVLGLRPAPAPDDRESIDAVVRKVLTVSAKPEMLEASKFS